MLSFPVFLHPKPRPAYPRRNDFTACFFRLSAPSSVLHLSPFFSSRFGTLASHSLHHGIAVNSFCFKHLRTTIFATAGWRGTAPRFLQVSLKSPRPAPSACGDSPWLPLSTVKLSTADLSLAQALWVLEVPMQTPTSGGFLLSRVTTYGSRVTSPLESAVTRFLALTPLESALTERALGKSFRMRIYEKRRGVGQIRRSGCLHCRRMRAAERHLNWDRLGEGLIHPNGLIHPTGMR